MFGLTKASPFHGYFITANFNEILYLLSLWSEIEAMLKFFCGPCGHNCLTQGHRKMKKVRRALRALKAQVLLGRPGTCPPKFFLIFSMLKHVFLHF